MKCAKATRLLPALIAGELSPEKARELESHLSGCPGCAGIRAGFDQNRVLLRRLPEPEPGAFLVTRVMAELRADTARPALRPAWLRPLVGAAMLLIIAGGVWLGAFLGNELLRNYTGPADDPLAVNGAPALTEYLDVAFWDGR